MYFPAVSLKARLYPPGFCRGVVSGRLQEGCTARTEEPWGGERTSVPIGASLQCDKLTDKSHDGVGCKRKKDLAGHRINLIREAAGRTGDVARTSMRSCACDKTRSIKGPSTQENETLVSYLRSPL